ncbi:HlyD family efflux transporter periplasmic adaptor subunit [Ampullimonas aquatilis]|uniref:HlyD family efflux transporter periplasmic adaptor subunit n=1 Tax=Ampullimonas aquatilis TaxID=1341549 RepID=UPI003C70E784
MEPNNNQSTTTHPSISPDQRKRQRWLIGLTILFLLAGAAWAAHWALVSRYLIDTDDAYVQGNVVQITSQVAGTVLNIQADDTDFVQAGQPLVRLDQADAKVALEQAEAQLAQTVREVRTTYTNNGTLSANIALREAEISKAKSTVQRAEDDVKRRQPLIASGAVSNEEMQHANTTLTDARAAYTAAQAALTSAKEQLASNRVLTDGTDVENHPNVQRAAAKVREAYLALNRNEIVAPVTGYVAKRSVQLGQRITAGVPLMALIPLDQVWVDANFKESQLREMRIGQAVTLNADMYGKKIDYQGKLIGLGAGTGSAFSLLPAQNATGNWIKVVQRVPVRIALDSQQLKDHPLRVGLSMLVTVDVHDQSGKSLADAPREHAAVETTVFDKLSHDADDAVKQIINNNLGRKTALPSNQSLHDPVADKSLVPVALNHRS